MNPNDPYQNNPYAVGGYPGPGFPPPYPPRPQNGLALASMITSLCALVMCPFIGVVGAIMGHRARRQIQVTGEEGGGFATAGIIVGWIAFGYIMVLVAGFVAIVIFAALSDGGSSYSGNYN